MADSGGHVRVWAVVMVGIGGGCTVAEPVVPSGASDSEPPPPPPPMALPCAYDADENGAERVSQEEAPLVGELVETLDALEDSAEATWTFENVLMPGLETGLVFRLLLGDDNVVVLETRFVSTVAPERCPDLLSWSIEIPILELGTTDGDMVVVGGSDIEHACVSALPDAPVDGFEGPLCDADLVFDVPIIIDDPFRFDGDPMGPILARINVDQGAPSWSAEVLQFPGGTEDAPTGDPTVLLATDG